MFKTRVAEVHRVSKTLEQNTVEVHVPVKVIVGELEYEYTATLAIDFGAPDAQEAWDVAEGIAGLIMQEGFTVKGAE